MCIILLTQDYNEPLSALSLTTLIMIHLYTDASGSLCYLFGAVFGRSWLYGAWPKRLSSLTILVLEMFPIVISIEIKANRLASKGHIPYR